MRRLEQDRRLLDAFRAGRREALAVVYREYAPLLARMLRSASGGLGVHMQQSAFELENMVAEVFARAFEPPARLAYDGLRPFEAFLTGIARNCSYENARQRDTAARLTMFEGTTVSQEGPEAIAEDQEVAALLSGFVAHLDVREQQLYGLRFEEGMTQVQAAQALGWSRIVLRRRERKLKGRLLEFLQARGYLQGIAPSGWTFARREE